MPGMVFVTGATGFLGGALTRRLSADGVRVRALVRAPTKAGRVRDLPGVEVVQGDLLKAEALTDALRGCDVLYSVGAALSGTLNEQRRVNVEGVRRLHAAAQAAGVRRVVHVSTLAIYGYSHRGVVTETTPHAPNREAYSTSKWEGEAAVRAGDVAYSIIRPGAIYGPHSGFWTRTAFNVARRRPTVWIGDGSGSVPAIYVDDVLDMLLMLAEHPKAAGEAFNCVYSPSPTWRAFLGAYARMAGHESWLGIPPLLVRPLAALAGLLPPLRIAPLMLDYIASTRTYSMEKARDLLGWQPRVGLAEGMAKTEAWLREKGLVR